MTRTEIIAHSWYIFVLFFTSANGFVPNFAILLTLLYVAPNLLKSETEYLAVVLCFLLFLNTPCTRFTFFSGWSLAPPGV